MIEDKKEQIEEVEGETKVEVRDFKKVSAQNGKLIINVF